MLENTINDRDITIKIQKEKIKALEQTQMEYVNHKHSLNASAPCNPNQSQHSKYPHPSSCTPCFQAPASYLPCHGHVQHHQQHPVPHVHPGDTGCNSPEHLELLKEIKFSLISIQDGIGKIAANGVATDDFTPESVGSMDKETSNESSIPNTIDNDVNEKDPEHIAVVSVEVMNIDNDDSIASADDHVPDIQLPPQQDLNYLA